MSRDRGGPIMFNLRIRPLSPQTKVTKEALRSVLSYIKENDAVPDGWEVAYIEWTHPGKASTGWKRGTEEDLGMLGRILRKSKGAEFRAAEVDQPRGKKGSSRELHAAMKRADKWHRARAKEMRMVDRLKTAEGRDRHRRLAEGFRKRYARAQARAEELSAEDGAPEFELAIDYKRRKR